MGIFKVINSSASGQRSLSGVLRYVLRDDKTDPSDGIVSGLGLVCPDDQITPQKVKKEFDETRDTFHKNNGRLYAHYVHSFPPNAPYTPQQLHNISVEIAQSLWSGHQVLCTTHTDKDYVHTHFIINSVSYIDGKKLHTHKDDLKTMKEEVNRICKQYGMDPPQKGNGLSQWDKNTYQMLEKSLSGEYESYLLKMGLDVEKVLKESKSKEDFLYRLNKMGYQVRWDGEKPIMFKDRDGHYVRLSNLSRRFGLPGSGSGILSVIYQISKPPETEEEKRKRRHM